MEPKDEKLSSLFGFLGEQQIKLQKLIDRIPEETCERCGQISEECICSEFEPDAIL
jgi:hypothetical protein